MKNRFPAVFLALAVCMGLAVPAFAAEGSPPLPTVSLDLLGGYTAEAKTDTYQIRPLIQKTVEMEREEWEEFSYSYDVYSYSTEPSAQEFTATAIPLGTGVRIDGVEPEDKGSFDLSVQAWSDPDGDGVYDQRFFRKEINTAYSCTDYILVPLGEEPEPIDGYADAADAEYCYGFLDTDGIRRNATRLTSSDAMYALFGPNTLVQITARHWIYTGNSFTYSEPEELACFLLTGGDAPPAPSVTTVDTDKTDKEFTLRSITEEFHPDNKIAAIYTDFTRNEETETVELDNVPVLTTRDAIQIRGLQTVAETQESWARVDLSAWSDPDGDGVYDQQLFTWYGGSDSITLVPLTTPGPFSFREIDYGEGRPIYSRSVNICGTDTLTTRPYSAGEAPSFMALGGNYLTWLFGPNTLVKVQAATAAQYVDGVLTATESRPYYFYIPADAVAVPSFNDVPTWCEDAVRWAAESGVTTGTSYHKFSPDNDCTQAQILTFLWRAAGELDTETPCPLTLPASLNYAEKALAWANGMGMIDSGTFSPSAPCTRADAVNYIWQAFGKESAPASSFRDVSAGAGYAAAVNWAVENGIVEGYPDGSFGPDKVCSRGVIAAMLHRACVEEARLNVQYSQIS